MNVRAATLILAVLSVPVVLRAADDPVMGTWKLNPAKTKYEFGSINSGVNVFSPSGPNGVKNVSERCCDAQGQKIHSEIVANFDGKDYPYGAGNEARDAVQVDRLSPYTYRVSYKNKGKTVQINYWSVSKDGKTLTLTSTGLTADNDVYHRLLVYDKQ